MGTDWYTGTGSQYVGRNRGTGSTINDYWSSPGTRTYYGYIQCVDGSGFAGKRSGNGSASVNVYTPAPSDPSWASISGGSRSSGVGGGITLNYMTVTAGGSSYASSYRTQQNVLTANRGWTGWASDQSCTTYASTIQGRADASGPGGTSPGWTYTAEKGINSLRNDNSAGC